MATVYINLLGLRSALFVTGKATSHQTTLKRNKMSLERDLRTASVAASKDELTSTSQTIKEPRTQRLIMTLLRP
jgi:hypothetical protein